MKPTISSSMVLAVHEWSARFPWLWHGFSTRAGGVSAVYSQDAQSCDLNLGLTAEDDPACVGENRLRLAERVSGLRGTPLVGIRQIHSGASVTLRRNQALWSEAPQADGILSDQPGVLLAVQTADCIPVLVVDGNQRVVAAFHAGWRGTVQRIVEQGIAQMRSEFGSQPEHLVAAIGPGIGACCYSVGEELVERFTQQFTYAEHLVQRTEAGTQMLDLTEANRRQLLATGIDAGQITTVGGCTCCQPQRFFSHRGQHGRTGRMMSVVGIAHTTGI